MGKKKRSLPRGWRIVRNLAVVLICLYALWARADYPLPTAELEFRRLERQYMLPRAEIQGVVQDAEMKGIVIGTRGDQVILRDTIGPVLVFWPRQEAGPTLVPRRFTHDESWVAAVDVPEGTESARLALRVSCWYTYTQRRDGDRLTFQADRGGPEDWEDGTPQYWEKERLFQGERLKGGAFLFRIWSLDELWPDPGELWSDPDEPERSLEQEVLRCVGSWSTYRKDGTRYGAKVEMEAVFYDAAGAELGRAALRSPEEE